MWWESSHEWTCVVNQDAFYNKWVHPCGSASFQRQSEADVLMTDRPGDPSGTKQIGWGPSNFG